MSQAGKQFGKEEIQAIQEMNERVVDAVLGMEKQQVKETAGPLDSKQLTKTERVEKARVTLADPMALGAWHDEMAQQAGLTPEKPISREWVAAVIGMQKELRDA